MGNGVRIQAISAADLERRLRSADAPFLLDVREPEEMIDGKIAGSINIPMDEVGKRLHEIPMDRDVVVICHVGARSAYMTRQLNALGYDRAVNLRGGMEAWLEQARD
ncbi:MAG TPA: rhodanese-like domain-containing protein [Candidatus Cybelea sp.]|nr:rhodanese-like domain-containing protein [Candidatus Cybelea sp.]